MEELIAKNGTFSLLPADENVATSVDSMIIKQDIYPNTGFITKRNYNQYGQVESVQIKGEIHTVFKNRIILNQYPSSYYRVGIKGFTEILTNQTLVGNQYRVAYDSGIVFFPPEFEGQSITIDEYYGIGVQMIPTSRIYIGTDSDGNITNTLYDMIKVGTNSIVALQEVGGVLADGKATAQRLEEDIANATSIDDKVLGDISSASTINQTLLETIATGNTTIGNLSNAQATGNEVNSTLQQTITAGNTANSNLTSNIEVATSKIAQINSGIQTLNTSITTAEELEKELASATSINSTLENNISTGTSVNDALSNNLEKANASIKGITTFSNLSIGGTNLLPSPNYWENGTSSGTGYLGISVLTVQLTQGVEYVVSGCLSASGGTTAVMRIYNSGWTDAGEGQTTSTIPTIVDFTFTPQATGEYMVCTYNGLQSPIQPNTNIDTYWVNVQQGNTGTSYQINEVELSNKVQALGGEVATNILNIQKNTTQVEKLTSQIDGEVVTSATTDTSNMLTKSYFGTSGVTSSSTSGFCNIEVNLVKGVQYTVAVSSCVDNEAVTNGNCVWTQVTSPNDPNTVWVGGIQNLTPTVSTQTFTAGYTGQYTIYTEYSVTKAGGNCTVYWYYLKQGSSISASEIQAFTNNSTTKKQVKGIAQIVSENVLEINKNTSNISTNSSAIEQNTKKTDNIADYLNNSIYSGYNLFANSNFGATGFTGTGYPVIPPSAITPNVTTVELVAGKTYTFTGMASISEEATGNVAWIDLFDPSWKDNPILEFSSSTPQIRSITFVAKFSTTYNVGLYTVSNTKPAPNGTFYWYSLVEGEKPYRWTMNAQDSFILNNTPYTAGLFKAEDTLMSHFCNTGLYYTNQDGGVANLEDCPQKVAGYLEVYNCDCDYWGSGSAGTSGIIYQKWTTYSNDVYTRVYLAYEQKWSTWNQLNSNTTATGFAVRLDSLGNSVCELALQNSQLKQQNQGIGEQVVGLNLDVTGLKDKSQGIGQQVVGLTLQNSQLKQQNEQLGKQVVALSLSSMGYESKNNILGQQLVNLTLKNANLEQQNEDLGKELVALALGNQKMQEQMEQLAKTIVSMQLGENKK